MAWLGPITAQRMKLLLSPTWAVSRLSYFSRLSSPLLKAQEVAVPIGSTSSPLLTTLTVSHCQIRKYAKSKDKKGKNKQTKVHVSDNEMSEVVDVAQMREEFAEEVEKLKQLYIKNLSLRTSFGTIENLPVELEGDEYPLNEVAQVTRKSAQMLIINATAFPQATPGIMSALRKSGLNINPQQEGVKIIVPLPKVTKEHRENLAKSAKTLQNKCKDGLRDIQNQYIRKVKKKEGELSEDLVHDVQLQIQEISKTYMQEAEKMMAGKQKELLNPN